MKKTARISDSDVTDNGTEGSKRGSKGGRNMLRRD